MDPLRPGARRDRCPVDTLSAVLAILVAIAILFEIARRIGVPYPTLFVLGGLGLALRARAAAHHARARPRPARLPAAAAVRGRARDADPRPAREPGAALRLSIGLVIFTMVVVAVVAHALVAGLGWAAAFALGAIVGADRRPRGHDRLPPARRAARIILTLIEGEALFNDATALVAYRAAVAAAVSGTFVLADALAGFVVAAVGGIAIGVVVGGVGGEILRRLDDPPVEVLISLVIPFAAYLPADELGLSGVLAAVDRRAGHRQPARHDPVAEQPGPVADARWKMVGFVLNGFVFVLIGLELPAILAGPAAATSPAEVARPRRRSSRCRRRHPVRVGLRARASCPDRRAGSSPGATRRSPRGSPSSWAGPGCAAPSRWPRRWRCRSASRSAT